jgi:hypothetical protein
MPEGSTCSPSEMLAKCEPPFELAVEKKNLACIKLPGSVPTSGKRQKIRHRSNGVPYFDDEPQVAYTATADTSNPQPGDTVTVTITASVDGTPQSLPQRIIKVIPSRGKIIGGTVIDLSNGQPQDNVKVQWKLPDETIEVTLKVRVVSEEWELGKDYVNHRLRLQIDG